MRMILRLSAAAAFFLGTVVLPCSAQTPYRLREVLLSPNGNLEGVVIALYGTYELHIDETGRLLTVELVTSGDTPKEFRFANDRIERIGKGLEACALDGRLVDRIGNYQFRYLSEDEARIESIGDTAFTYVAAATKDGRIDKIGGLQFRYSVAEGRVDQIGSLKMEYRVGDKFLDSFSRLFAKEKEQTFAIRVVRDVAP